MNLQQFILRARAALETPVDFADLERCGVLKAATDGWYVLLQPKALPVRLAAHEDTSDTPRSLQRDHVICKGPFRDLRARRPTGV
jgi:hypothetical protein